MDNQAMKAKLIERARHGTKDNVVVITPQMAGVKKAVNPFAPDTKKMGQFSTKNVENPTTSSNPLEYYWQYVHHSGELSKYDFVNCSQNQERPNQINLRVCLFLSNFLEIFLVISSYNFL